MYKIYDDVLSVEEQDEFQKTVLNSNFPLYWVEADGVSYTSNEKAQKKYSDKNTKETKLMVHSFHKGGKPNSELYSIVETLLHKFIERTEQLYTYIFRCKLNLQHINNGYPKTSYVCPHVDLPDDHIFDVLIYYPIDSDGNTILFKNRDKENYIIEKEVEPKKGRFLLFGGKTLHTNRPPQLTDIRMSLNYNLGYGT